MAKPDELAARVDELFSKWNDPDVPGCAVGIVRQGKLIYSKGFGSANLDYDVPNSPQTIFEIASASKSFTCACLALLMDQGKIRPEDDLRKFVPEMHPFDPPVRIEHMVRCRSGLWNQFHIMPLAGWDNEPVGSPYSAADLFTVLCGQKKLPFEPGTQFEYASGEYYLLGLIVERVSGRSLADFARENLFEPLGMTRTFFEQDPTLVVKNRAVGHLQQDGAWHQSRVNFYLAGGAGVKSCVDDLYRWDQNFYANRLPTGKYFDEFIREGTLLGNRYVLDVDAYLKQRQPGVENPPAGQYRGLKRMQFTGGLWGMSAAMSRFPEQQFTAICLSNNDDIAAFIKTREIADLYLADALDPLPAAPPAGQSEEFVTLPAADIADKAGAYRLVGNGRIWQLTVKNGDLHLVDQFHKAWRLKPLSSTEFRAVGESPFYQSARFHFRRETPDQPYSMTLESNDNGFRDVIRFDRVELIDPAVPDLAAYAGEYVSDELAANYRFAVKEGGLWLRVGSRRWERLDPTVLDEFIPHVRTPHDNRIIRFLRDGNDQIRGFAITFWAVKNLEFTRRIEK